MDALVRLELMSGPSAVARIEASDVVEIGRTSLVALGVPADPHMSARHFAITCDDGRCHLRDLDSTNGTFVNGARVSDAVLEDGDQILATWLQLRLSDVVSPALSSETFHNCAPVSASNA